MHPSSIHRIAVLTLGLAAGAAQAASTPDPGDYVPAPPYGATPGVLYGQHVITCNGIPLRALQARLVKVF